MTHPAGDPQTTPDSPPESVRIRLGRFARSLHSGRRGKILTAFFLLLTVTAIATLLYANRETLLTFDWQLRPWWLVSALTLLALDLLLGAYAWHLLVSRLTSHGQLSHDLRTWNYANLARRLPGPIWYMASRALIYEKRGVSKVTISLISGLEIVLILIAGILTFLLVLPFWALPAGVGDQLSRSWLLLPVATAGMLLVHPRVLTALWRRLSQDQPTMDLRWRDTISWVIFYLAVWAIGGGVLFSIVNFVQPLAVGDFAPVLGMWAVANTVSLAGALTISGFGLREVSLAILLTQFVPAPVALVIAILVRVIWLIGELMGALLAIIL